ncbi:MULTISPECIES: hypothetical protein [Microbacterium]|uniref:Uncharacterized protein n=1 Tax=Microbacterium maritypicum TaxID=33918 RepID=A0AAJ5VDG5_MICMQ|nr:MULTISPECIES: hypothetical protein [Microbacterium]EYT58558.1 hypothetical protein D514_0116030 [Microbacterium sp. UCD-TDU]WEF22229.1 hypothetical protein PWF71_05995 [Microbacterium liquefaciens]
MIVAGFILLAVGAADLVRQFAPRRWIGYLSVAVILLLLGSVSDALLPMVLALVIGALWVWCMPTERAAPLGFWPAVLLAVVSVGAVVWLGARSDVGLIGATWQLRSPFGEVPFDLAMLALGAGVFLLESSNLVVRAALDGEHTWRPTDPMSAPTPAPTSAPTTVGAEVAAAADAGSDAATGGDAATDTATGGDAATDVALAPRDPRSGFKGGRLIGPLERILVLILTLAAAYPILAAMLAAKGIVRFPEISRDGETGARAEYFLVGSLVSWVIALSAAFLVWWAAHS